MAKNAKMLEKLNEMALETEEALKAILAQKETLRAMRVECGGDAKTPAPSKGKGKAKADEAKPAKAKPAPKGKTGILSEVAKTALEGKTSVDYFNIQTHRVNKKTDAAAKQGVVFHVSKKDKNVRVCGKLPAGVKSFEDILSKPVPPKVTKDGKAKAPKKEEAEEAEEDEEEAEEDGEAEEDEDEEEAEEEDGEADEEEDDEEEDDDSTVKKAKQNQHGLYVLDGFVVEAKSGHVLGTLSKDGKSAIPLTAETKKAAQKKGLTLKTVVVEHDEDEEEDDDKGDEEDLDDAFVAAKGKGKGKAEEAKPAKGKAAATKTKKLQAKPTEEDSDDE